MCERYVLKKNAKASLRHYFGSALLVLIIQVIIGVAISSICSSGYFVSMYASVEADLNIMVPFRYVLMIVLSIFVTYPIYVGVIRFFIESRKEHTAVSKMFYVFKEKSSVNVAVTMFLKELYVALWSLLFFIPGLIKYYEYFCVPYILAEQPEINRNEAFRLSREMTRGYKWDIFIFELSFLLWVLGVVFTFGLLYIYLAPYLQAAMVELYECLKANYQQTHTSMESTPQVEIIE